MPPTKRTAAESGLPNDSDNQKKAKQGKRKKPGPVRKNPDLPSEIDWKNGTGTINGTSVYKGKNILDWHYNKARTKPVSDEHRTEIKRAYSREKTLNKQPRNAIYEAESRIRSLMRRSKLIVLLRDAGIDISTHKKRDEAMKEATAAQKEKASAYAQLAVNKFREKLEKLCDCTPDMEGKTKKTLTNNATSEQIEEAKQFAKEWIKKQESPSTSVTASASSVLNDFDMSPLSNPDNSDYAKDTDCESGDENSEESVGKSKCDHYLTLTQTTLTHESFYCMGCNQLITVIKKEVVDPGYGYRENKT